MEVKSRYHQSDHQLQTEFQMIKAAQKNAQLFEPLYKKYHEQIFRYVYQRMDDKDMAADVTAQVFVKALTNLTGYEYRGVPFSSWLYRIAMSEVFQNFKDNKAIRTINVDTSTFYDLAQDEMPYEDNEGDRKKLIELLGDLPENELQLIEMRYFEKRSYKEIGEILDITENNAKVKAYRIIEKLKKKF